MIRGSDIKTVATTLANLAAAFNPGVAVAMTSVEALSELFVAKKKLDEMFAKVYDETKVNAPAVALQVSDFYSGKSAALDAEFAARPGK